MTQGTYDSTTGGTISFNGIQVAVNGDPATGDQFTVAPAGTSSAFATIQSLITTLNSTGLNSGQMATQISQAIEQLSSAVNNLNDVQASVGARINAVTAAQIDRDEQPDRLPDPDREPVRRRTTRPRRPS